MSKRILIIDDDEELCEELTETFEREGFEVGIAHNGANGREMMDKDQYQMVILDLKLPGMRGSEVLKLIKGNEPEQKVIILSGKPFGQDITSGPHIDEDEIVFHSADAVMKKPVKVEDLIDKVKELVSVGESA
jgi:two-component system, OmpR family, response regulator